MATTTSAHRVDWNLIWAQRGFRYFFVAMFVSLFGSGMNLAGVSWYILAATHSTVKVSWQVIVMTLPGLFVPFLGGVLIDRSEEHTSELQSHSDLVCRLLLEKKKKDNKNHLTD